MSEFLLGGQAVLDGVMMRGPAVLAIAVRRQDGAIIVAPSPIPELNPRFRFMKWPMLRGMRALWQSLALGMRALSQSAQMAEGEDGAQLDIGKGSVAGAMVLAFGMAIGLFFFLPLALTQLLAKFWTLLLHSSILFNLIEGGIRLAIFLAYLLAIRLIPDVKRFFQYHGAEHKAIYAFEAQQPLEVAYAREKSPLHPRCGTSFLMTVMVVAILVISLTPHDVSLLAKAGWRLLVIPLIAGLSFEVMRFAARSSQQWVRTIIAGPGLLLQRLTTQEPTDEQLEVALAALKAVDLQPSPAAGEPPAVAIAAR